MLPVQASQAVAEQLYTSWRHLHFVNMSAYKPALSTARGLWICRLWFLDPSAAYGSASLWRGSITVCRRFAKWQHVPLRSARHIARLRGPACFSMICPEHSGARTYSHLEEKFAGCQVNGVSGARGFPHLEVRNTDRTLCTGVADS